MATSAARKAAAKRKQEREALQTAKEKAEREALQAKQELAILKA